ncbi:hypothetical protein EV385_2248 [Krasilnikovia cinnamomea]|uniref:Uncharacterized protein n=1 Tax=Krasilnikovia cinnamomea TaxID=349313 RepID=A0A4V2G6Y2_9ACTN|nr:hypothetical protein [Krasilnikovia cinnamomea]RZU50476.1 hypothetical protein EV385_2248 [Krasilnikovia cinnamomea]
MIRPAVLLFALLMSAPAVYRYVTDDIDISQVLIRFLIAVPIAALLLAGLRFVTAGYGKTAEAEAEPSKPAVTPEAAKPVPDGSADPESAEHPS